MCPARPGNVHSADGWEHVLKPVLTRYSAKARPSITRRRFRADAAFTIPALFDLPGAEGWDYAIRIKGSPKLYGQIGWLMKCRPGRPPNHVVREYTGFHFRAKSWSKARRVVAKVEFHPGELFPTVGFIVTNHSLPNERMLAFARSSIGVAVDGRGVSGARRGGVPRCAQAPILGFAGLASANRSIARAINGLIAAPNGGTFSERESNGESRFR